MWIIPKTCIKLQKVWSQSYPERGHIEPRARYCRYYRDLYARYGQVLDESTFRQGGQYRFDEMAAPILDVLKADNELAQLSGFVMTHWAHEFDPEYASCGPYFAHRYQFDCTLFDVIDQGNLCTFSALYLMVAYFEQKCWHQALCLGFDQTTVPRSQAGSSIIPTVNRAAACLLSREGAWQIHGVGIFPAGQISKNHEASLKALHQLLHQSISDLSELIIFCHQHTVFSRLLSKHIKQWKGATVQYIKDAYACTEVLNTLYQLHDNPPTQTHVLIIDERCTTLAFAWIWLSHQKKEGLYVR